MSATQEPQHTSNTTTGSSDQFTANRSRSTSEDSVPTAVVVVDESEGQEKNIDETHKK